MYLELPTSFQRYQQRINLDVTPSATGDAFWRFAYSFMGPLCGQLVVPVRLWERVYKLARAARLLGSRSRTSVGGICSPGGICMRRAYFLSSWWLHACREGIGCPWIAYACFQGQVCHSEKHLPWMDLICPLRVYATVRAARPGGSSQKNALAIGGKSKSSWSSSSHYLHRFDLL